ncbi:acetamidase/formamidase family protein [Paenarthrobacter sp. AR 02]|uniref:acetamidase/formamidase family protein n=1 Tax=Paenarthrobacter sp. AR 02 TaxID=2899821 RepID=UPI001F31ECB2|nr:acetamidase/formamidase family protein [Paenarthrobacter sp. AR 02]MCF3140846.1 acetamidase/formamidase family protein [Paenarthrobacter sp. AR 02]
MKIHTLAPHPADYSYVFGGKEPLLAISPGDAVQVWTEDCYGGQIRGPGDLPSSLEPIGLRNPVSGPIEVLGAVPGDILAVHFVSIVPARAYAVSCVQPRFGALAATMETALLNQPMEERVWRYDIDVEEGTATFHAGDSDFSLTLPLDPMLGTVGVAPAHGEVRLTKTPHTHGGNMDTPEVRAGTTLYLPVNVPGAMLSLGDGHARQGEGEVCGTGLESAMNSVIVVDVVKDESIVWPRLESDEFIMSSGSARPLEDAFRISQKDLVEWTSELTGLAILDALQLVSQLGLASTANVCDPNYTMVAKLPKRALKSAVAYGGIHERLRLSAREYMRAAQ